MGPGFLLTNVLVVVVSVGAWHAGLLGWLARLPSTSLTMLAFLGLVWLAGVGFVAAGRYREVFHVANLLPMLGLLGTGLGIQIAGDGITEMSPEAAFAMFRGIIMAMPTTFLSLFLMIWLRELAWWTGRTHV